MGETPRINLDSPQYDQSDFIGRLQHFSGITDWRLCFKSDEELDEAKDLLQKYKLGQEPPGTPDEKIWYAKRVYESAFHPDTGEKQNVIGRMSFQVPGGMILTGAMLTFYKSTPAVVFWQWANQSFNALVNFTNRNAKSPLTVEQMGMAYISATGAALGTALGLKSFLAGRASTLLQRYVPFAAVAAANCINVPLMRQNELMHGIVVCDEAGNELVNSKVAAVKGISQVVLSRIIMAAPGMTLLPVIMERLEKQAWLRRNPRLNAPFQVFACGVFLTFMTPTACSIFNQKCSLNTATLAKLEPDAYARLKAKCHGHVPDTVNFNKGL
ncbi:sideroflexin-2-like [Homarus americanus]|uniref:Sidoreflexin n=1 Tax=Homarus americanus TaxID=6706 RepID=A0A8J5JQE2_HOMAM|nr:sideroflexin-2-like [Homarus americanus]XP_042234169.1 sideroflexin-2-like [Homarus americanus]XP_042234170.1 sideroflexin-2-like [Homarus americanus]KAG7162165.1 Sideroflexin-2-like [Homarus americanus]